jgi:hypothetical protein
MALDPRQAHPKIELPEDQYDVAWTPHPGAQTRFLAEPAFEALYGGAAGGGKSDCLLFGGLRQVEHPDARILFLRGSFPELQEVLDRAHGTFPRLGATWSSESKRYTFPSGARYEFGYGETYTEVQRYLGQEYTSIRYDEIGRVPEERVAIFLISRIRTKNPRIRLEFRASANPGGPGHGWLKRRYIIPCGRDGRTRYVDPETRLDRAFIPARLADNPSLSEQYRRQLMLLPEVLRKQLLEGDWEAGEGLALPSLHRHRHLIKPFNIPGHWPVWLAHDWGFAHPAATGLFVTDEHGTTYLVDSIRSRQRSPKEIAHDVAALLGRHGLTFADVAYTVAGHDIWQDRRARGETVPTIAEQYAGVGWYCRRASISRVAGLQNFRAYLEWHSPDGQEQRPRFLIVDTEANRRLFDSLEQMVSDPDHPEDALKVDADRYGEGGDDDYDMVRYALASRPLHAERLAPGVDEDRHPGFDVARRARKSFPHPAQQLLDDETRDGYRAPRYRLPRGASDGQPDYTQGDSFDPADPDEELLDE